MTRQLLSSCSGACSAGAAAGADAAAVSCRFARRPVGNEGAARLQRTGSPVPDMTMQHCTDETTDKEMSTAFSPMGKDICSKQDIQKTATGYVTDSVCGIAGMSITSHAEITGDFNSAYTVKSTAHSERGPAGAHDTKRRSRRNGSAPARPIRSPATS